MNDNFNDIITKLADIFTDVVPDVRKYTPEEPYTDFLLDTQPTKERLLEQREYIFDYMPEITVVVAFDAVDSDALQNSVSSILAQSYARREIIIACACQIKKSDLSLEGIQLLPEASDIRDAMKKATDAARGEWIIFLDIGDMLSPDALYEMVGAINNHGSADAVYGDEDAFAQGVRECPRFKPEFSIDSLRHSNIVGSPFLVRTELHKGCGGKYGDSPENEYDYILRVSEGNREFLHVAKVLCTRKEPKEDANSRTMRALLDRHLQRCRVKGYCVEGLYPGSLRVRYNIKSNLRVGIIVFGGDEMEPLRKSLESVEECSTYENYEITVIDTGGGDTKMRRYIDALRRNKAANITDAHGAPLTKAYNDGAHETNGDALVFMEAGVEVLSPDWIETMLEHAMQEHTGAVCPKLLSENGSIVSVGVVPGINGWWASPYAGTPDDGADMRKLWFTDTVRTVSAVGESCFMVSSQAFYNIGGFDESFCRFGAVVELCLRFSRAHYNNIYTPYATMRSDFCDGSDKTSKREITRIYDSLRDVLISGDPFYSPNYDYRDVIPRVAIEPIPPLRLNSHFGEMI